MFRQATQYGRPRSERYRGAKPITTALFASAGIVLSACSGSADPDEAAKSNDSSQQSASGVLRIAADLSGESTGQPTFNPGEANGRGGNVRWALPVYDSLLHYNAAGKLTPGLASNVEVTNPSTVDIALRPGLKFSDGTPLTAAVVKTSLLRNKAAENGGFREAVRRVAKIDVSSPVSLTVHLSKPLAGQFYKLLAGPETFVWPKSVADPGRSPIGAGPFKLKEFQPNNTIVLVKNENYWNADDIELAEIHFVNVARGPQQINALRANQVDLSRVPPSSVKALEGSPSIEINTPAAARAMLKMPLCKTYEPLRKAKVRQALSFGIDRAAIDSSLLNGRGEPAWAMYPADSPLFPDRLKNSYEYNPDKARRLLAEAGYPNGFDLTLIVLPGSPLVNQVAQLIQADWKKIGVDLQLKNTSDYVSDLYIKHQGQTGVNPSPAALTQLLPGVVTNLCNNDDPTLNTMATELFGLAPESPQAIELWKRIQTYISEQVLTIWLNFNPHIFASKSNVTDLNMISSYFVPIPDYHTVHMAS